VNQNNKKRERIRRNRKKRERKGCLYNTIIFFLYLKYIFCEQNLYFMHRNCISSSPFILWTFFVFHKQKLYFMNRNCIWSSPIKWWTCTRNTRQKNEGGEKEKERERERILGSDSKSILLKLCKASKTKIVFHDILRMGSVCWLKRRQKEKEKEKEKEKWKTNENEKEKYFAAIIES